MLRLDGGRESIRYHMTFVFFSLVRLDSQLCIVVAVMKSDGQMADGRWPGVHCSLAPRPVPILYPHGSLGIRGAVVGTGRLDLIWT